VRFVREKGVITYRGQTWTIGRAFAALPVGLRPSPQADGQCEVFFAGRKLGHLDLTQPKRLHHLAGPLVPATLPPP